MRYTYQLNNPEILQSVPHLIGLPGPDDRDLHVLCPRVYHLQQRLHSRPGPAHHITPHHTRPFRAMRRAASFTPCEVAGGTRRTTAQGEGGVTPPCEEACQEIRASDQWRVVGGGDTGLPLPTGVCDRIYWWVLQPLKVDWDCSPDSSSGACRSDHRDRASCTSWGCLPVCQQTS